MILALVCVPLVAGLTAFGWRSDAGRRMLLVLTALAHLGMTGACWLELPAPMLDGWLNLDSLGLLFLSITSILFLASSVYCLGYLGKEHDVAHIDFEEHLFFSNEPEAVFTGCLLLFLASMTLVTVSQHFGLLWVGIEATTLASAPLIYFHRQHRSLEATWKYLLICSVGIALALLGNFLLAVAASGAGTNSSSLVLSDLLTGKMAHVSWLKAAFLFFLVGYGTKMGLAPMHNWLPDAHSESPSLVSALLSGALLNCAFLGILRAHQVCAAAGEIKFSQGLLLFFGLLSMGMAAIFIIAQADYKRMLAYSSVEHMGILAIGVGLGGAGALGASLHAINHSFTKAMLFLVAGNILATFGTKSIRDVRGVLRVIPYSGVLWLLGFLAITGTPPFGPFLSEFTILKAALDGDRNWVAAIYLLFLAIIFIGMAGSVLAMTQGPVNGPIRPQPRREGWWSVLPPLGLSVLVLLLGVYIPPRLGVLLDQTQQILSPGPGPVAPSIAGPGDAAPTADDRAAADRAAADRAAADRAADGRPQAIVALKRSAADFPFRPDRSR